MWVVSPCFRDEGRNYARVKAVGLELRVVLKRSGRTAHPEHKPVRVTALAQRLEDWLAQPCCVVFGVSGTSPSFCYCPDSRSINASSLLNLRSHVFRAPVTHEGLSLPWRRRHQLPTASHSHRPCDARGTSDLVRHGLERHNLHGRG